MRVTGISIERSLLQYLSSNLTRVAEAQEQIASGFRVNRASDDPTATIRILEIDHQVRQLEQFRRHTGAARARLAAEDSVLQQTQNLMDRARQLAIGGGTSTATPASMQASAVEIGQIISQINQSGNTRIGNEYIFAGNRTDAPPFQGGVYVGDGAVRQLEIDDGLIVDISHNGDQLFVSSGILQSLTDLQTALQSGSTSQVRAATSALDGSDRNLQTLVVEVGSRLSAMSDSETLQSDLELDLRERRSELAEVDFEKATIEFLTAQTVLEAARATASHILNTTLTDFLR